MSQKWGKSSLHHHQILSVELMSKLVARGCAHLFFSLSDGGLPEHVMSSFSVMRLGNIQSFVIDSEFYQMTMSYNIERSNFKIP